VHDVGAGFLLEILHAQVRVGADAVRSVIEVPGLGLCHRDQVGHALYVERRVDHQHRRNAAQYDDRREILDRIVGQLAEQMRVGGHRGVRRNQEREAVRRRARDRLRANGIIPAGAVIDDDRLAPRLGQPLGDDTGHGVGDPAGRNRHDELNGTARIGLRIHGSAHCREQADKRGEQHSLAR
jgi:hypothetical protein